MKNNPVLANVAGMMSPGGGTRSNPSGPPAVRSAPSAAKIQEWLSLAPEEVAQLREAIRSAGGHGAVDATLDLADKLMHAHGVEAIRGDYHVDRYYYDIVALYVNTGDTYNATLLYETDRDRFVLTDWGSWVERNEKKYRIE